ncbi:hypothetical protein EGT07_20970 [Herbaspirillum sp. HC18]|nr:hypothetical protein EGT07_20970 [Herbaspirillum sp. HC18]
MDPELDAQKLREIYAYLGYAMFLSQSLEGLLTQAIFVFVIFPAKKSEVREIAARHSLGEWEAFIESHDERLRRESLGKLLLKLKMSGALSPTVEQCLKDALVQRNYVAHNFFKERLATLGTEKGQDDAIFFLRRAGGLMQQAIDCLSPLVFAEFDRYGYDAAYIEDYARNAIKNVVDEL